MIEYRCLDCGKRYAYGDLVKARIDTCPLCGYDLVPAEAGDPPGGAAVQAASPARGESAGHSTRSLIATFAGVSGLILALAVLMPK